MRKDLSYYLKLDYQILLKQGEENGRAYYEAEIPDLPGCGAFGKNRNEALLRLDEAKEIWIAARLKRSLPIPEPALEDDYSGRILLRIPAKLHLVLSSNAKNEGLSLNQFIRRRLESELSTEKIKGEIKEIKEKIDILLGRYQTVEATQSIVFPEASASPLYQAYDSEKATWATLESRNRSVNDKERAYC